MRASSHQDASHARAVVLHVRNRLSHATRSTEPLTIPANKSHAHPHAVGIAIGREQCYLDPLVSGSHGTLECTPQHGVWVFVDHSERGTLLNQKQLVHRDAVIVRDGDVLSLGNTEITLAFQIYHNPTNSNNNSNQSSPTADSDRQQNSPAAFHNPLSSQLAKQLLPNINTEARPPPPPPLSHMDGSGHIHRAVHPEYTSSPIPGANWRKKRHSISHVTTRMPISLGGVGGAAGAGLASSSQTFARTFKQQPPSSVLVPSAPSTPPIKDAPSRPGSHIHVASSPLTSPYNHVKWQQPEPENKHEDPQQEEATGEEEQQYTAPPPPLEYSSSPLTSSFLDRHMAPPQAPGSPPTTTTGRGRGGGGGGGGFSSPPHQQRQQHPHPFDSPPSSNATTTTNSSHRPMTLRMQVAKRNAGQRVAANQQQQQHHTPGSMTAPTVALSRGITIPTTSTPTASSPGRNLGGLGLHSILKKQHPEGSSHSPRTPPSSSSAQRRVAPMGTTTIYGGYGSGGGCDAPASPVARKDIDKQNQSLLAILQTKSKQEQRLQREQQEWMQRAAGVAAGTSTSTTGATGGVPSMSPIRLHHESGGSSNQGSPAEDGEEGENEEHLVVPARAPALLRTISLGHAPHHQQQQHGLTITHQPSPRLTAALLASRSARKSHDHNLMASAAMAMDTVPQMRLPLREDDDVSVASSVSTEPSTYRRVTRSMSFSSSRLASSGELSDFVGYDDDDDAAELSFTSSLFFGADPPSASSAAATAASSTPIPMSRSSSTPSTHHHLGPGDAAVLSPNHQYKSQYQYQPGRPFQARGGHHRMGLRGRLPSLDDEMAGVLNSPSHAAASGSRHSDPFGSSSSSSTSTGSTSGAMTRNVSFGDTPSVHKPRAQSADLKKKPLFRRIQQIGIDGDSGR